VEAQRKGAGRRTGTGYKVWYALDEGARRLIRCYLAAGMMCGDVYVPRSEGTPQGGPLSPLLANLLLDELDRELTARGHFRIATARSKLRELSSWMIRKLRCFLWKQWGSRGYRELRKRGVSSDLAWNTSKSAHGPWRISRSPALGIALPTRIFVEMGLPLLHT